MSAAGIRFERDLNAEQLAAVTAPDGPVLVLAAAGTGKTRTLTYRVAHLVDRGVDPQRILLLTFTNKAAREMLDRAQALVGDAVGGLWGGTFHHMANRILRRHAERLGYRADFVILDEDEAASLVKKAVAELHLEGGHFPKPDVLLSVISYAANTGGTVIGAAERRFGGRGLDLSAMEAVHVRYAARKRELNAMDFDDLLVNGLRLFREHPEALVAYQERFLYVLVDEYQDTNAIQAAWIDALVARRRNLLVVGDDFQSIYSWRGADFRNFLSFTRRYPDAAVFKLETNYRSVPEILEVANACIAGNPEQFQKTLHAVREPYRRPIVARLRDGAHQALYVAEQIRLLRREGYRFGDIAVLYRAHFHAMELQLEFAREQIPYVITSGVRFFEQAHIKDVCSLLRLFATPGDALAFNRLLGLLPRMGARTCERLWGQLGGRFDPRDPAQRAKLAAALPAAAKDDWRFIVPILEAYEADSLAEDPGEVIHRFLEAFYDDYAVETFENYDRRIEDIRELIDYTTRFEDARQFLNEMALMTNLDVGAGGAGASEAVKLSTIHQAKGLEWPVIFVLWLAEGLFPSSRSLSDSPEAEAEERRLFYVAVTRAKDELHLCCPSIRMARDGGRQFHPPSRFVDELPPDLIEER